ncbi:MAG: RHS repeat-associated core domain-containing protein [Flavobacteriaceae bacterium]|nr:RHS repeat-associated core domain-containing protein [Flavobacteriaceae bacterium]
MQKTVIESGKPNTLISYAGNYIYEDNTLQFFNHSEGYVEPEGTAFNYIYQYKDHLGNIRLSYTDVNQNNSKPVDLQIIEENNYYPFGLKHKGYNTNIVSEHPYKFSGKELNKELGLDWYDFGARNYDAALGRWMNIDALSEQYYEFSTYNYTLNNPIYFVDPDGNSVDIWKDKNELTAEQRKGVKVYIFYDPKANGKDGGFPKQAMAQYDAAVEKYGEGSVALSDANTEAEFAQDWGDIDGTPEQISINAHGSNQALHLDSGNGEYVVSTGDGKTNVSGTSGTNVSDLPTPKGDLSNTILNLNTCNANNPSQNTLTGNMETLAVGFSKTSVGTVRASNKKVNISETTGKASIPFSQTIKGGTWQTFKNGRQQSKIKLQYSTAYKRF